jgi:glucokinase
MNMSPAPGLIADIGGTNARFALAVPGEEPRHALVLPCAEFAGPAEAAEAYLARVSPDQRPVRAAFAIAAAVTGDAVEITNNAWKFSIAETERRLGVERLQVVNDFTAVALCVPLLQQSHRVAIGGGAAVPALPIGVLGPGTGLGVSALVPGAGTWHALATEGGHVTMPAANAREARVIDWLRGLYEHVSAERVLSGPGLMSLYSALNEIDGKEPLPYTPDVISAKGLDGSCPVCRETLQMFFAMLGTIAGNVALTLGARGGVYIAGGILPRMVEAFAASPFRARFEAKGRFHPYLAAIPTYLITHPYPAFLGLSGLVK